MTLPYAPNSATSKAAAELAKETYVSMARYIHRFAELTAVTCKELEDLHTWKHQTVSARMTELAGAGCISGTGEIRDKYQSFIAVPGVSFEEYEKYMDAKSQEAAERAVRKEKEAVVMESCLEAASVFRETDEPAEHVRAMLRVEQVIKANLLRFSSRENSRL